MQLHNQFDLIDITQDRIKAYVLDFGKLYKTVALDKKQYIIKCKDDACKFRIRAT
jgi:hypothetical protein